MSGRFWTIFWLFDPLKGPLYYQQLTFGGSYSPKSFLKLALPDNASISNLSEVEMNEMRPKVVFLAILTNFWALWSI